MQISPINNYQQNMGFKAVYPVYFWLSQNGSKYNAVRTEEITRALNGKIIRILNKPENKPYLIHDKFNDGKIFVSKNKFVEYVANKDNSFGRNPIVRSFYNREGGFKTNKYEPIAYIITGDNVAAFDKDFAMPIGREMREAPVVKDKPTSAELDIARTDYVTKGLNYVKQHSREFSEDNMPFGLHIKMRQLRRKTGTTKGYDIDGYMFLPEKGKENPFVKLGYVK